MSSLRTNQFSPAALPFRTAREQCWTFIAILERQTAESSEPEIPESCG
jgi:hypothetical protein